MLCKNVIAYAQNVADVKATTYFQGGCKVRDRRDGPDNTGLGTTATAVVLQGPKIRLYGRIITSEAAGGLMSVHGTMVNSLL